VFEDAPRLSSDDILRMQNPSNYSNESSSAWLSDIHRQSKRGKCISCTKLFTIIGLNYGLVNSLDFRTLSNHQNISNFLSSRSSN